MSKFITFRPLGEILQDAGLITAPQIQVALNDQKHYQEMRLGEILALRGWIKQDTADFFVEEWFKSIARRPKHPIGFYLNRAGLLTEQQIQLILQEQNKSLQRFGTIAVSQGLIKQNTVDFFLKNLFPHHRRNLLTDSKDFGSEKPADYITSADITHWVILSTRQITSS